MKKFILLALIVLMMIGCEDVNKEPTYPRYVKKSNDVKFVVIDSCEYIINKEKYAFAYTDNVYETYTHKGNCRFCKERDSIKWEKRKKELLEELIIKLKEK